MANITKSGAPSAALPINQVSRITNALARITLGQDAPTLVNSSDYVSLGTKLGDRKSVV